MKKVFLFFLVIHFSACTDNKIGYINLQAVFNDFAYKKELEKELGGVTNSRKFILDSLETNLKILAKKINSEKNNQNLIAEYNAKKDIFLEKKSVFAEEQDLIVKHFDDKIVAQLNSYVREFGKKEKFDVIYGATNTGNIMYADTTLDLTKRVTIYINEKFKGKD